MATVVCATDLTAMGHRAVGLALAWAKAAGADLVLLHVADRGDDVADPVPQEIRAAVEAMRTRIHARIAAAAKTLETERSRCAAAGVACTVELAEGHPWEAIIEVVDRMAPDLLVVGPHRMLAPDAEPTATLGERLLGTTADRVVRHAPCPVLVATGVTPDPVEFAGARWVVGVDFSDESLHALRIAKRLADQSHGTLTLTHVVLPPGGRDDDLESRTWQQVLREHSLGDAERRLGALAAAEAPDATVSQRVSFDRPGNELALAADEQGASVLVVGTHGRTGLARVLLGSVAERCLHVARCPVLVVRGPSESDADAGS